MLQHEKHEEPSTPGMGSRTKREMCKEDRSKTEEQLIGAGISWSTRSISPNIQG